MQYSVNPRNGDRLSRLGLGAMRLPRKGGQVDQERTTALVQAAVARGVNYFDTAYIYPGSEEALGNALAQTGLRDQVYIATKLPHYLCKTAADFDRMFDKQLQRLRTDHVDYYLMHMLSNATAWQRLCGLGIENWIAEKRRSGQIRNVGFSFHGGRIDFAQLLDAHGWDFCMIQYNYMDEYNQAGKDGLTLASEKGLPVFVMEPLRGGMLATGLPQEAQSIFSAADSARSPAAWGLRWVWNHPEVTLLLSGMGAEAQLDENARVAETALPGTLSDPELAVYAQALQAINRAYKIPCTGCGYCMPCPRGVDIPTCFSCYNESYARGFSNGVRNYLMTTGVLSSTQSNAAKCVKCHACEKHCPQQIPISDRLGDVSRRLESFWFRPAAAIARKVMRLG